MSTDETIIELQSQLAFQEHTIAQLNDVVTSQQKQIDVLTLHVRSLQERVGELSDRVDSGGTGEGNSADEKPPHY